MRIGIYRQPRMSSKTNWEVRVTEKKKMLCNASEHNSVIIQFTHYIYDALRDTF